MKNLERSARAGGFSLTEVMVAVVVICVGLLGIAKMQALALSSTTTSRLRALAAIQAAGLAAAMHSNREYWAGSTGATPPATITFNAAGTGQFFSTDNALQTAANGALTVGLNTPDSIQLCVGTANAAASCSGVNGVVKLAAFDLARWAASLNALLPNPQSTISCAFAAGGPAPPSCTIVISWSERAVAINQQQVKAEATNGASNIENPSYLLYVEP